MNVMHRENQTLTEQPYRVYYIVQQDPEDYWIIIANPVDEANFLGD